MARGFSIAAAVLSVLVVAGASAHAQQGTGELRGRVVDAQNAVLPGVTVVANEASGQFREIVSSPDGSFFERLNARQLRSDGAVVRVRCPRGGVRVEVGKTVDRRAIRSAASSRK
jgi:hypothetical protein